LSHAESPEKPLSVFQLTALIKGILEEAFPSVWVVGELSDVARPQSGHVYLTLKDDRAQIRAVIWRNTASRLRFNLEDGLEVICRGDLDVYPPRGSYQLVIRELEPRGEGALQQALRKLQQKLAAEGLFDPAHKKPLPRFPRRIAVVTSPTGAAVRDFVEVLRRRWQGVHVLIVPTRVQGAGAAAEIATAIQAVNRLSPSVDVMVVGRGGGSMEDLWCFNEEAVVRAIFASQVPVVSAVGHEIDVTLSDLVADVRALTPSEAAERVVPALDEVMAALANLGQRLETGVQGRLLQARSRLDSLAERRVLRRPLDMLRDWARQVDELQLRSARAMDNRLGRYREQVEAIGARLESLSPLAVLGRGYTVTSRLDDEVLIRDSRQLQVGELIQTRFAEGKTISRVEQVDSPEGRSSS
jgi:exodeoxyribonuclease VII large subunit